MEKSISLSGINRAVPYSAGDTAETQEIVNMRFKDGAWRPEGDKKQLATDVNTPFGTAINADTMYIHTVVDGKKVWIAASASDNSLVRYACFKEGVSFSDNTTNLLYSGSFYISENNSQNAAVTDVSFYSLDNVLIITYKEGNILRTSWAIWNSEGYDFIYRMPDAPKITYRAINSEETKTTDANATYKYIKVYAPKRMIVPSTLGAGETGIFEFWDAEYIEMWYLVPNDSGGGTHESEHVFVYDCSYVKVEHTNTGQGMSMIWHDEKDPPYYYIAAGADWTYKLNKLQYITYETARTLIFDGITSFDKDTLSTAAQAAVAKARNINGKNSQTDGYIFAMAAYQLYDGSYIRCTSPSLLYLGSTAFMNDNKTDYNIDSDLLSIFISQKSNKAGIINMRFGKSYMRIDSSTININTRLKKIIRGISVFLSAPLCYGVTDILEKVSINTLIDKEKQIKIDYTDALMPDLMFEKIINFYNVLDIPFDNFADYSNFKKIDVDFTTIATLPTMPADINIHEIASQQLWKYNSRLFTANSETILSKGDFHIKTTESGVVGRSLIRTTLNIDKDTKYIDNWEFDNKRTLGCSSLFAYNDIRATKIDYYFSSLNANDMITLFCKSEFLKHHPILNCSYLFWQTGVALIRAAANDTDSQIKLEYPSNTFISTLPDPEPLFTITDKNKIRISALNNPFVFPPKLTYQVNDEIRGFASNTLPISQGQFGQHPVFIFTNKGIWAMQIGTSDVFIQNVVPLNDYVCTNGKNIININQSIVFNTKEGIMLLQGYDAKLISEVLNEYDSNPLYGNVSAASALTHGQLGAFNPAPVDNKTFLEYMNAATIGYDSNNMELWLVNGGSAYSYVFDVKNNIWSKRSNTYRTIIADYPKLYGIPTNTLSLYDMSDESPASYKSVFMQTRPMKVADGFNKVRRLAVRSMTTTNNNDNSRFGYYLFASYDGKVWTMVDGKEVFGAIRDGIALASRFSAKFFILVMAGKISPDSYLTHIDVELTHALGAAIR